MGKFDDTAKSETAPEADAEANNKAATVSNGAADEPKPKIYPQGWKLHALTAGYPILSPLPLTHRR